MVWAINFYRKRKALQEVLLCKLHVKTQIQHRQITKPMLLISECDNAGHPRLDGQKFWINKAGSSQQLMLLYFVYAAFPVLEPNTSIRANLQRVSLDKMITAKFFHTSSTAKIRQCVPFVYILAITQGRFYIACFFLVKAVAVLVRTAERLCTHADHHMPLVS